MTAPTCPTCGFLNLPGAKVCDRCGNALIPQADRPEGPNDSRTPSVPRSLHQDRRLDTQDEAPPLDMVRDADRTAVGLQLMMGGFLIAWIPVAGIIGVVFLAIGALFAIFGRDAFGYPHTRNVAISVLLWILGGVGFIVLSSTLSLADASQATDPETLRNILNAVFIGGLIVAALIGLSELLFTYALQERPGRILLWAAFGAGVTVGVVTYLSLLSLILSRGVLTPGLVSAFEAQAFLLGLLNVIPAVMNAAGYVLARGRILRGEIPVIREAAERLA